MDGVSREYSAVTDSEGNFQIDSIQPGDYRVTLERNGLVSTHHRARGYSSTFVSLTPGQELDRLLFRMLPAGVIHGKITDEDGDPIPDVPVTALSPSNSRALARGVTNDLGEYRISGLQDGKYFVLAEAERQPIGTVTHSDEAKSYAPTFYPGTMDRDEAAKVEVHPGDEVGVNFSLVTSRTFKVHGAVAGVAVPKPPEGPGTESPMVVLRGAGDGQRQIFAEHVLPNKTFEITGVFPGSYRAYLVSGPSWPVTTGQTIEVRGADVNGVQLSPEPVSQIHGQFRMDTGQKVDWSQLNVLIDADERDMSNPLGTKVLKDGSFSVEAPAGSYHVWVTSNSNTEAWRDFFMQEVIVNGKDVGDSGFAVAGSAVSLEIVASAKGSAIEGNVSDDEGKAAPDIQVVCIPDANRRKRREIYQQVKTDRHGHFAIRGLNAGEYQVFTLEDAVDNITDPDFVSTHEALGQSVQLGPAEHKAVTLKLAADIQP